MDMDCILCKKNMSYLVFTSVFLISVCPPNDALCEQDKIGYDAIQQLHLQIDDDNDGSLDRSESDEVRIILVSFSAPYRDELAVVINEVAGIFRTSHNNAVLITVLRI